MKIQHLAIIFILVILPISLIMGEYIHSQIETINNQSVYTSKLYAATYDAVEAFKLNTVNNNYSTLSDSKLRDIKASINTFYNSLGQQMKLDLYKKEDLSGYTPAILFNLYDGYYIYSKYFNQSDMKYEYGVKPYIYYTCRYKNNAGTSDFIINYTLDNFITIYGTVKNEKVIKSGYLIDKNKVTVDGANVNCDTITEENKKQIIASSVIKYDGIEIKKEELSEIVYYVSGGTITHSANPVNYIIYNNNKIYCESYGSYYSINDRLEKSYYVSPTIVQELNAKYSSGKLLSDSARTYYVEAAIFSDWVSKKLNDINQTNAVDVEFTTDTGSSWLFDCTSTTTYSETGISGTIFDINRMEVIRQSITTNLKSAIANFNAYNVNLSYDFVLPKFTEDEWYNITNNITVVSFMQGMSVGTKYYNDYCIIVNNQNMEVVNFNSLSVLTNKNEMHLINCKDLINTDITIQNIYKTVDLERKFTILYDTNSLLEDGSYAEKLRVYYFLHSTDSNPNMRCYDCIIGPSETYKIDFLKGTIENYDITTEKYVQIHSSTSSTLDANQKNRFNILRSKVLHAIARERYDLYKINGYFGS